MKYLIKTIGVAGRPVPELWVQHEHDLKYLAFPKHREPGVDAGDRLVLYATGHQRLIAAGVFTREPRKDPDLLARLPGWRPGDPDRWPWVADWEPQVAVPSVHLGPELADIGVSTYSIRSQSHIYIEEGQYQRAVGLLASAAAARDEVYVPAYRGGLPAA